MYRFLRPFHAFLSILHDFTSDYKTRLMNLQLLPLMFWIELQDLLFLVKCMKDTSDHLNLSKYITIVTLNTRLGTSTKLKHNYSHTTLFLQQGSFTMELFTSDQVRP